MSATLRIHRGSGEPGREVYLGRQKLGALTGDATEFPIPTGRHVLELKLGSFHSNPAHFDAHDGELIEYDVVDDPDAVLPMLLGRGVKLVRTHAR
ncbi:MAG: hypothetical protein ABI746_02100 [Dermatophilaceae bacterium]